MLGKKRLLLMISLVLSLNTLGKAQAGPIWDWMCGCGDDCPKSSYSCLHFWAPSLSRANDCIHGPKIDVYAPDRHPEVEPGVTVLRYHCPPAAPIATFVPVPTAPPTSVFKYLDKSSFGDAGKSANQTTQDKSNNSPPESGKKTDEGGNSKSKEKTNKANSVEPSSSEPKDSTLPTDPSNLPTEPKKIESKSKSS